MKNKKTEQMLIRRLKEFKSNYKMYGNWGTIKDFEDFSGYEFSDIDEFFELERKAGIR